MQTKFPMAPDNGWHRFDSLGWIHPQLTTMFQTNNNAAQRPSRRHSLLQLFVVRMLGGTSWSIYISKLNSIMISSILVGSCSVPYHLSFTSFCCINYNEILYWINESIKQVWETFDYEVIRLTNNKGEKTGRNELKWGPEACVHCWLVGFII